MPSVSLNIDLGELPSEPEELYVLASIVNIACGGHAGDRESMSRACALAKLRGTELAAHPSYPDRENFGRRSLVMSAEELSVSLLAQLRGLGEAADQAGLAITAIKPHGALYHDAAQQPDRAQVLLDAVERVSQENGVNVALIGPREGLLHEGARGRRISYLREGFADRGLLADGTLIARGAPDALIEDPELAARQALRLAESGTVETICVHGDTRGAVAIARSVRHALEERGLLR